MPESPTTLPQLFAYIASSPPYHNPDTTTPFPELADFLQHELKSALYYGISTFRAKKTELEESLIEALQQPGNNQDHASTVHLLKHITMGPITEVDPRYFGYVVTKSKYGGDLWYENCVVGLMLGIRRLKMEVEKLKKNDREGERDDWFVVDKQELEVEKVEGSEEGEIRVRLEMVR